MAMTRYPHLHCWTSGDAATVNASSKSNTSGKWSDARRVMWLRTTRTWLTRILGQQNALSSEPIGIHAGNERNRPKGDVACVMPRCPKSPRASVFRQSLKSPTINVGKWSASRNSRCVSKCSTCQCRSRSASPRCQCTRCNSPCGVSITANCAPRGFFARIRSDTWCFDNSGQRDKSKFPYPPTFQLTFI